MLPRVLEPEVMDSQEEARDYDAMDHAAVNRAFVDDFLAVHGAPKGGWILDVGTGTARIPIELCRAASTASVLAVDLAPAMLSLGRRNVESAGLSDRIRLELRDAKTLAASDGPFEAVVSNSIIHHIPDPASALAAMIGLTEPGGTLFVRDLSRPRDLVELQRLVDLYASGEGESARALFAASLHAALTLEEVRAIVRPHGIPESSVLMTSDRHWTVAWRRPAAER